jgi:hypothetical protein
LDELRIIWENLRPYIGNAPMWGVFAMALIALIRAWPKLKEIGVNERAGIRDPYLKRIRELAEDVKSCRRECDAQERRLRQEMDDNKRECDQREREFKKEIDSLKEKMNNEAWQRVQSEISLVNTLIQVVDAPELRRILEALQKRSATMISLDVTAFAIENGKEKL